MRPFLLGRSRWAARPVSRGIVSWLYNPRRVSCTVDHLFPHADSRVHPQSTHVHLQRSSDSVNVAEACGPAEVYGTFEPAKDEPFHFVSQAASSQMSCRRCRRPKQMDTPVIADRFPYPLPLTLQGVLSRPTVVRG